MAMHIVKHKLFWMYLIIFGVFGSFYFIEWNFNTMSLNQRQYSSSTESQHQKEFEVTSPAVNNNISNKASIVVPPT